VADKPSEQGVLSGRSEDGCQQMEIDFSGVSRAGSVVEAATTNGLAF
jgi:hypothetical protein